MRTAAVAVPAPHHNDAKWEAQDVVLTEAALIRSPLVAGRQHSAVELVVTVVERAPHRSPGGSDR